MNLGFKGLGGEQRNEDTAYKIRQLLFYELDISHHVEFGNVHRFGRYVRGRCRPIVARFLYQEDLDLVLDRAKWLHGSIFIIQRQYPTAMEERRRELIPIMRQLRMEGAVTKLVRDTVCEWNAQ